MRSKLRQRVWDLTRGICFYCQRDLTPDEEETTGPRFEMIVEHKTPITLGGSNLIDNLAPSCAPCNRAKGLKTVDEFRVFLLSHGYFPLFFCDGDGHPSVERDWIFVAKSQCNTVGLTFERF